MQYTRKVREGNTKGARGWVGPGRAGLRQTKSGKGDMMFVLRQLLVHIEFGDVGKTAPKRSLPCVRTEGKNKTRVPPTKLPSPAVVVQGPRQSLAGDVVAQQKRLVFSPGTIPPRNYKDNVVSCCAWHDFNSVLGSRIFCACDANINFPRST